MEKQVKLLAICNYVISVPLGLLAGVYLVYYGFFAFITTIYMNNPLNYVTNNVQQVIFVSSVLAIVSLVDIFVAIFKMVAGKQLISLKEKGRVLMLKASIVDIISRAISFLTAIYAISQFNKYPVSAILPMASMISLILSALTQQPLRKITIEDD